MLDDILEQAFFVLLTGGCLSHLMDLSAVDTFWLFVLIWFCFICGSASGYSRGQKSRSK